MVISEEDFPAWKKHPDETYEEFKRRFGKFHKKILKLEYNKEEREYDKLMKYRAWDRMPGESLKEFRRRLQSEKRTAKPF